MARSFVDLDQPLDSQTHVAKCARKQRSRRRSQNRSPCGQLRPGYHGSAATVSRCEAESWMWPDFHRRAQCWFAEAAEQVTNDLQSTFLRRCRQSTDHLDHFWPVAPSPLIIDFVRSGSVAAPPLSPDPAATLRPVHEGRLRAAWDPLTSTDQA